MKQVRAAVAAGYDVTLLTNGKDNGPQHELIADNCRVIRFNPFDRKNQTEPLYFDRLAWLALPGVESHESRVRRMVVEKRQRQAIEATRAQRSIGLLKYVLRPFVRFVRSMFRPRISPPAPAAVSSPSHKSRKVRLGKHKHLRKHALYALNIPVEALGSTYGVIHAHDLITLPGAVYLSKRFGAKVVYDAHEMEVERYPPLTIEKRASIMLLESECLKHVDSMITVSEGCAEHYARKFPGDVAIVMNVPERVDSQATRTFRDQLEIGPVEKIIVYTGAVGGPGRGLHLTVQALDRLPSHHLVVLGNRRAKRDEWLRSFIGPDVARRVHLLPAVSGERVVSAIASADLAICPIQDVGLSYRHSMPNKLFEAMEARLPICVSNLPDMKAFVERLGIGIAMDQTSPSSIARAIEEVSSHERASYYPPSTIDLIEREFCWNRQKERQLEVYRSLLTSC